MMATERIQREIGTGEILCGAFGLGFPIQEMAHRGGSLSFPRVGTPPGRFFSAFRRVEMPPGSFFLPFPRAGTASRNVSGGVPTLRNGSRKPRRGFLPTEMQGETGPNILERLWDEEKVRARERPGVAQERPAPWAHSLSGACGADAL